MKGCGRSFGSNVELARHVRDRVFRLEECVRLLRDGVSLNTFMYCVHRINHYGVLSFNWSEDRPNEGEGYLRLVRKLWPQMNVTQKFEIAISLAKLHQRRPKEEIIALINEFLYNVSLEECRNYTFNQLMHLAIILTSKNIFYRCLALAAVAQPTELLLASRLALVKNLSKFAIPERAAETEETFRRYFSDLQLEKLSLSDLLGLYFSVNNLLRKFPQSRLFGDFLAKLDRQLASLPVSSETIYRANFSKVLSGSRFRPASFFFKWMAIVLGAPSSFSRHAVLSEAIDQLTPALVTPELLAYFVYDHPFVRGPRGDEAVSQLCRVTLTPEIRYLLELLPATPVAFLAERLKLLDGERRRTTRNT